MVCERYYCRALKVLGLKASISRGHLLYVVAGSCIRGEMYYSEVIRTNSCLNTSLSLTVIGRSLYIKVNSWPQVPESTCLCNKSSPLFDTCCNNTECHNAQNDNHPTFAIG